MISAREDRYNHLLSDEDDDADFDDIEIGNFSTCSPRFSRLYSSSDTKEFSTELKDLEETSKEASSAEDLGSQTSDAVDCETSDAIDGVDNDDSKDDSLHNTDSENKTVIEYIPLKSKMTLKTRLDDKLSTDSGNDSGTQTSSSLDSSINSTTFLVKQIDGKRAEDSDRDTE